ncbi:NERD domain-containing protein, partial [Bacillus sp. JJ1566]
MQFGIKEDTFIRGVRCPKCDHIPMKRTPRSWHCLQCQYTSKTAYLNSISDYSLLMGNTIKNKKLSDFLNLKSPSA